MHDRKGADSPVAHEDDLNVEPSPIANNREDLMSDEAPADFKAYR